MITLDFLFLVTIFLIGFIGSYLSGMVGIGGSIVKYPMLLYIPPMLGLAALTPHEVSGINAVQVFFATLSGVWAYRKGDYLNKQLILYMGTSILIGGLVGSFSSSFFSEHVIQIVYGILAMLAVILMLLPKPKERPDAELKYVTFNKPLAAILSFIVGVAGGIVGAAGAFILVPIMIVILKIPTRMTIATSLAITFISSIGTTIGKVATGQVLFIPAIVMVIASIIGSPLGVATGKRMNTKVLQWMLAILIFASAIKIWLDILK